MKKITLSVFSFALLAGTANAATITVNTTVDEFDAGSKNCSLRAALHASASKITFAGCIAGETGYTDVIQLDNAVYTLNSALEPEKDVRIVGYKSADNYNRDIYTGVVPKRLATKTVIQAATGARIFNTSKSRSFLEINDLSLVGGQANGTTITDGVGGAILAGGGVVLSRVKLTGAYAGYSGGAIYLQGALSSLTLSASELSNNTSAAGASVVDMSCVDNLLFTPRNNMTITRSSIVNNGSASSAYTIALCGIPKLIIESSTFAENTASNSIISFQDNTAAHNLFTGSSLILLSSSLMQNRGVGITYNGVGTISLINNVLGFNYNNALACQYTGSDITTVQNIAADNNLVTGTDSATSSCQLPPVSATSSSGTSATNNVSVKNTKYAGSNTYDVYFNALTSFGDIGLPGYLPKLITEGVNKLVVDSGVSLSNCGTTDQRGVSRQSGLNNIQMQLDSTPVCDVGALEYSQLTANDDLESSNESYVRRMRAYFYLTAADKESIKNGDYPEDLITIASEEAKVKKFLTDYKAAFQYRRVFAYILDNDTAPETLGAGVIDLQNEAGVSPNPIQVTVTSLGSGPSLENKGLVSPYINAKSIECIWNDTLKAVMIRRIGALEGTTTPSGDFDICQYTISYPSDPSIKPSTAIVQGRIINIAPIAYNKTLTLQYYSDGISNVDILKVPQGQTATPEFDSDGNVTQNLLMDDSDDGDGNQATSNGTYPSGRSTFFITTDGKPLNIKIKKQPTLGTLKFEYEGACPDNNSTKVQATCYGGKMTYLNKNTFSPFNDSFTYTVMDADKAESNEATISIVNTATTTEDSRKSGSFGIELLAVLAVVALIRQKLKMVVR